MALYNIEGDIHDINPRQLEYISNVIKDLGYENSKVTVEPLGKAGDNYVASVKRITIQGEKESLKLIAKIAPSNEFQRKLMNTDKLFYTEHFMYSEVLPKFVQQQRDANIPEEEQLKYAKHHGSLMEKPNEVVLLEDLKTLDFTMLDRFKPLSNDCIKSVLKNFASLHSLSYVLKNKEPLLYNEFKSNLFDLWVIQSRTQEMKVFLQGLENEVLAILDDPDHIQLAKKNIVGSLEKSVELSEADLTTRSKHAVISQGDAWTNNIMFRFQGDTLAESIMIDYQMSRNSSPVSDLMYMIFNCTDYESRKQHFHEWIDYYHSELDKALSNYGLKASVEFPREEIDVDFKRYASFIFGQASMLASMLVRKSDDVAKMMDAIQWDNSYTVENIEEMGVSQLDLETKSLFKNRIVGLIKSFIELELL